MARNLNSYGVIFRERKIGEQREVLVGKRVGP